MLPDGDRGAMTPFARGARAIAGASLLGAVGFPAVILVIGTPIVLLARAVQYALTWLARSAGMTGSLADGVIGLSSMAGGVLLFTWAARLLLSWWRSHTDDPGAEASSRRQAVAVSTSYVPEGTGRA